MPESTPPTPVTLEELLRGRELRAERQKQLLREFGAPLVSITVNMPGPCKDTPASRRIFEDALEAALKTAQEQGWAVRHRETRYAASGPEGFLALTCDGKALKKALVNVEETHPLGRLFDLDVLDENGAPVSRGAFGVTKRPCLICDAPAAECGRSRRHSPEELLAAIDMLLAASPSQ